MSIEINQIYLTKDSRLLKVKRGLEAGVYAMQTVDEKGKVIPNKRNSFGHVIDRCERFCSGETIKTFKLIK
jgi:hypothetical protein